MLRRSILFWLVLAMFGAAISVAVGALRPRSASMALGPAASPLPENVKGPHWDVARVDPLPGVVALNLSSPSDPATPKPHSAVDIAAVQRRLAELNYYGGPIDGAQGGATRSAVMAFQKVNDLRADGRVGPATLGALESPRFPSLRGGPGKRVEVDLSRQVLYYVEGGELARIMPISSGNGASYEKKDGNVARSLTPVGTFQIQRAIAGVREADLGTLYDPMYFYQGWAIHGSDSVPAFPASHGCVRVTRTDALWLFDRLSVGTTVMVYGGTHTFTPGSSAPGTTTPAGDGPVELPPAEEPEAEEPPAGEPEAEEPPAGEPEAEEPRAAEPSESQPTEPVPTPQEADVQAGTGSDDGAYAYADADNRGNERAVRGTDGR